MDLMERSFDTTAFTKKGPRLLAHDTGRCIDDPNSRLLDNLQAAGASQSGYNWN
ncbi:MAG: hypothetical protein OXH72_13505 [Caldilineaceae bacterium]|nr:hypothetical protein [Caldilineaceae bacterium]